MVAGLMNSVTDNAKQITDNVAAVAKNPNVLNVVEGAKAAKNLVNLFMAIQAMAKNPNVPQSKCSKNEMDAMV